MTSHDESNGPRSGLPSPPAAPPAQAGGDPLVARYREAMALMPSEAPEAPEADTLRRTRLLQALRQGLVPGDDATGVVRPDAPATAPDTASPLADAAPDPSARPGPDAATPFPDAADLRTHRGGGAANQPRWWIGAAASLATLGLAGLLALQVEREAPDEADARRGSAVAGPAAGAAAAGDSAPAGPSVLLAPARPDAAATAAADMPPPPTGSTATAREEAATAGPRPSDGAPVPGSSRSIENTPGASQSPRSAPVPPRSTDRAAPQRPAVPAAATPRATGPAVALAPAQSDPNAARAEAAPAAPPAEAAVPAEPSEPAPLGASSQTAHPAAAGAARPAAPAAAPERRATRPPRAFPGALPPEARPPTGGTPHPDTALDAGGDSFAAAGAAAQAPTGSAATVHDAIQAQRDFSVPHPQGLAGRSRAFADSAGGTAAAGSANAGPSTLPLHAAARSDSPQALQRLQTALLEARRLGLPVDQVDAEGRTALWHAADAGRLEAARLLLDAGADPLRADRQGISAVQQAERRGHAALANLLRTGR